MTHLGGRNDCLVHSDHLAPEMAPEVRSRHSISLFNLVGRTRFELVTSSVSGKRSPAELTALNASPRCYQVRAPLRAAKSTPHRDHTPAPKQPRRPRGRPPQLATVHPTGRPHVRPVLAVWLDGALPYRPHRCGPGGYRHPGDQRRSASAHSGGISVHVRLAGDRDRRRLRRPYGAPTAGPPPCHPYEITPSTVFGFGTADEYGSRTTRYRF